MNETPSQRSLDISLSQRIAELEYRLARDGLTGARSRDFFLENFESYSGVGGALFFLDIDNFKCVNDHYGHIAGDSLLTRIAENVRSF